MKKALFTGFLGIAFAFAMASCNGNATATDSNNQDTTNQECQKTEECMKHCEATCPDSVCLANKCENCTCPDSSACHQKPCCKEEGKGECCKAKAEGCKGDGECKKECESKK